ncbi:MAG TPA: prephenate dehydrogenase [Deltaproteobacteria bacterium]|nr:prephenate dehydrogenase [Deltaproteobacteria bacterium]
MKITIVGLGLIGASMAKALGRVALVAGVDTSGRTVRQAMDEGVIAEGSVDTAVASGSDVVVLAVPVGSVVETAWRVIRHIGDDTVLTDTGSTKAHIVESIERIFPSFVGSHPIAGREDPGYASSRADLFDGAATIITPTEKTRPGCIDRVRTLWETCGSTTHTMDPAGHDRLMAMVSHLPHLLSYVSMRLADDLHLHRQFLGAGFRDFTRIAASDPIMWRDIFLDNKDNILPLIDAYMEELDRLRTLIDEDRAPELQDTLSSYARIRRALYGHTR